MEIKIKESIESAVKLHRILNEKLLEEATELAELIETLGSGEAFVYDSADFKYGRIYQAWHQIGSVGPQESDKGFVWL